MEINNKFLDILSKSEKLNLAKNVRDALISDIKELRDLVFNAITDTKGKEPLAGAMQEEYDKQHNNVNHPKYYTSHASGVECIEITRHYNFDIGNAIKYLWRAGLKKEQGLSDVEKEIEDCKKAIWYINDHIKHLKNPEFTVNGEQPNSKTF